MSPPWVNPLQAELKALGWSVPQLARRMGKDDQATVQRLYKIVRGQVENPRGSMLKDIAKAIGTTESALRHGPWAKDGRVVLRTQKVVEKPATLTKVPPQRRPLIGTFDPDGGAGGDTRPAIHQGGRSNVPPGEIPQVSATLGLGSATDAEYIEIPVGHGSVAALPVVAMWKVPETVLRRRLGGGLTRVHVIECRGDSMEPRIKEGDFVFIDTSQIEPSPPGIFAINDGMSQTLKRLELVPNTDPQRVALIPENPRHKTWERELDQVSIIGRYVARLTMD